MNHLNTIQINNQNQKDNLKGQKIVAALYLVTNHLSDTDPIKVTLRSLGTELATASGVTATTIANRISTLLGAAGLANLISSKNVSILTLEVQHYATNESTDEVIGSYFSEKHSVAKRTFHGQQHSSFIARPMGQSGLLKKTDNISNKTESKDKRQSDILSFINIRKSVGIKDIATLFPQVSEKTIQRELTSLVGLGKITKRGSKRWSIYMAI